MSHICPRGPNCAAFRYNNCKYTRRESVSFPLTATGVFDVGDAHIEDMHTAPRNNSKHKAKQSVDEGSEIAPSESGCGQDSS
jgi:hypothetical protein